jgi:hypothetical protein
MKPENLTVHIDAGQIREHYANHPDLNTITSRVKFSEGFCATNYYKGILITGGEEHQYNTWQYQGSGVEELPQMNFPHSGHCQAIQNDAVWAISGKYTYQTEKFSMQSNSWEKIGPLNFQRAYATAIAINGRVYVVGGVDGEGNLLNSVEYFTDRWILAGPDFVFRNGIRDAGALVISA